MKKYFAKYLPVEGEIKVGEQYINKVFELTKPYRKGGSCYAGSLLYNNIYLIETRQKNQTGTFTFSGRDKYKQKIKLFLCSKAIQVGDEYFDADGNSFTRGEDDRDDDIASLDAYKVMGEISPESTWVKEGDEYSFGKVDKNDYLCPYNQEDEKYIEFWTERGFRDLPNI